MWYKYGGVNEKRRKGFKFSLKKFPQAFFPTKNDFFYFQIVTSFLHIKMWLFYALYRTSYILVYKMRIFFGFKSKVLLCCTFLTK